MQDTSNPGVLIVENDDDTRRLYADVLSSLLAAISKPAIRTKPLTYSAVTPLHSLSRTYVCPEAASSI